MRIRPQFTVICLALWLAVGATTREVAAQTPPVWLNTYNINQIDGASGVVTNPGDGTIVAAGWTAAGPLVTDLRIIKTDAQGNPIPGADRVLRGSGRDEFFSLTKTATGYAGTGLSTSFGAWGHAPFLVTFDADTRLVDHVGYLATGREWGSAVRQTSDGGFIIAGGYDPGNNVGLSVLLKTDAHGNLQWAKQYNPGMFLDIIELPGGDLLATGYTTTNTAVDDMLLVRTTAAGETIWARSYGSAGPEIGFSLAFSSDGHYIVGGVQIDAAGEWHARLWKLSELTGAPVWNHVYGTGGTSARRVAATASGLYFTGQIGSPSSDSGQPWLVAVDNDGQVLWDRVYQIDAAVGVGGMGVQPLPTGGIAIATGGNGYNSGRLALGVLGQDGTLSSDCAVPVVTTMQASASPVSATWTAVAWPSASAPFSQQVYSLTEETNTTPPVAMCQGNLAPPVVASLAPAGGTPGTIITVSGSRFGSKEAGVVLAGSESAPVVFWSDTLVQFRIPVTLTPGAYPVIVTTASATSAPVTLTVYNPTVWIRPNTVVRERDSETTTVSIPVYLSEGTGRIVTVVYRTVDGSATADDHDYVPAVGTVTFPPFSTEQMLTVVVHGDRKAESGEMFKIVVTEAVGATPIHGPAVVRILNDDRKR